MFVRTSTDTVLLRKATHPSDFFSISVGKKNKINPQSWRRRVKDIEAKEDAAMKGPPGPIPLFPLQGECYWCKMALCLSETPAS